MEPLPLSVECFYMCVSMCNSSLSIVWDFWIVFEAILKGLDKLDNCLKLIYDIGLDGFD